MNSINTPSMRVAEATIAPTAGAPGPTAAPTIPATSFSHYHVLGDGDCLFRAMYMGLTNQPGVEPSQDQVMSLRQYLADYVYQHQQTLADNPAFEGRQGVLNLYDLLLTPGQWNHNTGDLVAPLLAQVSGRPLAVLQPAKEGTAYHVRQVFPAENPMLPAGTATTGEPSVCLAHINGNHYGYLQERYPNVLANALAQSPNVSALDQASSEARPLEKNNNEHRPSSQKIKKNRLNDAKKQELVQLWQSNPSWGERKIADEFMKINPNLSIRLKEYRNTVIITIKNNKRLPVITA